jgi:hypothetical protein
VVTLNGSKVRSVDGREKIENFYGQLGGIETRMLNFVAVDA